MKKIIFVLMLIFAGTSYVEAGCSTVGVVKGLDRYGDNFLSVRKGPATRYGKRDYLYNGDIVRICEWKRKWLYVKYSGGRYGWVYRKYIKIY